jgi:hypothetical protein
MQTAGTTCSTIAGKSDKALENANPSPDEIGCRSDAVIGESPTVTIVTF